MEDYKEIFDKFMQRPKEELAALLTVDEMVKRYDKTHKPIILPTVETPKHNGMCKDWSDCTNPHFDCVNCPLRSLTGGYTINTNGTFSSTYQSNTMPKHPGKDEFQFNC